MLFSLRNIVIRAGTADFTYLWCISWERCCGQSFSGRTLAIEETCILEPSEVIHTVVLQPQGSVSTVFCTESVTKKAKTMSQAFPVFHKEQNNRRSLPEHSQPLSNPLSNPLIRSPLNLQYPYESQLVACTPTEPPKVMT